MAKSKVYTTQGGGRIEFNMTPLIDVTFQLIIFFILAGQIVSTALAQLRLPKITESQAQQDKTERPIINVVSHAGIRDDETVDETTFPGQAKFYQVGVVRYDYPLKPEAEEAIVENLKAQITEAVGKGEQLDDLYVEIRSDYRVKFYDVQDAMLLAVRAGFKRMHIAAQLNTGG